MTRKLEDFIECNTCRAKPGNRSLCAGCVHNRDLIGKLSQELFDLRESKPSKRVPKTTLVEAFFPEGVDKA